jgi:hypothetical protein
MRPCWFLAADFDKKDWQADVRAFTETCRRADIPYALERSRSGNGAHVWFFFSSPVAAATARRMGSYLLTETMARRHQLSISFYDRLFPNQDTIPKGGFGNLIALPLQFKLRQEGNTLFLDDELEPFQDQWGFLSTLPRIPTDDVERKPTGQIDVAMIQSLLRKDTVDDIVADYGQVIIDDILHAMEEGRSPILLTERKEHLERLHQRLKGFVRHIVILHGGRSKKDQREVEEQLAAIPEDEERVLLAIGKYIGEGFNDARLDTLFVTLPVSWRGILVQYSGRLHRRHPGKHEVRIVDYFDSQVPMLSKMFKKRRAGYRSLGYQERDVDDLFS